MRPFLGPYKVGVFVLLSSSRLSDVVNPFPYPQGPVFPISGGKLIHHFDGVPRPEPNCLAM